MQLITFLVDFYSFFNASKYGAGKAIHKIDELLMRDLFEEHTKIYDCCKTSEKTTNSIGKNCTTKGKFTRDLESITYLNKIFQSKKKKSTTKITLTHTQFSFLFLSCVINAIKLIELILTIFFLF